ncbi:hypothetical protein [Prevotella pallens]
MTRDLQLQLPKRISRHCYRALCDYYMVDTLIAGTKLILEKGWRGKFEAERQDEKKENELLQWLYDNDIKVDRRCKYLTDKEKEILRPLYENAGYTIDRLKELKEIHAYKMLLDIAYEIFN